MIYDEKLLWEKQEDESLGYTFAKSTIEDFFVDDSLIRGEINLPGFSEAEISRHFTRLSTWNYSIDTGIYPLGSCTMKYNPKSNEKFAALPGLANIHPLQNSDLCQGSLEILYNMSNYLKEITGMDDVTLQPAAGAHGELTGMLMFNKYHKDNRNLGQKRNIILIPDSAHGTNPASATLCGFKTKTVKSNFKGIITPEAIIEVMDESVAGLMITNPNTLGLFETNIKEICDIIHKGGGLVYADGANMNAIMGIVQMGRAGVDAMHLNLHKTFSTPHGGGGPGAGPVCVSSKLSKYLPNNRVVKDGDNYKFEDKRADSIGSVHGFYGNFSVVLKAYSYILSHGAEGLKEVSQQAVLNANYIKSQLKDYYHIPYTGDAMHEVLFTDKIQQEYGVTTLDIAKRLIENGIHPPTIYFPLVVTGAMLIEPTESESLESLDYFIDVMINIAKEAKDNPEILHNAPQNMKRERVDETLAARKPILTGDLLE